VVFRFWILLNLHHMLENYEPNSMKLCVDIRLANGMNFTAAATTTPWSMKTCHFHLLNSSVQHGPILIIFGVQHQEETLLKRL